VPPCQSRSRRTPVKAHNAHEPRAPSIGSTQCLATPGAPQRWDESFHVMRLVTPASQPVPCRRVRVMARSWLLPRAYRASKPAWHPQRRCLSPISAVDLLSWELARCPAHEPGAFARRISATLVEPRTRHACTERDTSRPRGRWLAVAGITCLEWRTGLAPITPAVTWQSPPLGDAWKA
jgi:hypothetical protein